MDSFFLTQLFSNLFLNILFHKILASNRLLYNVKVNYYLISLTSILKLKYKRKTLLHNLWVFKFNLSYIIPEYICPN